jgi:hypothetical protein
VTTRPCPYSTDSEHDRRVRALLCALAASAGVPVEELLQQICTAARALGQPLPTGIAADEPPGGEPFGPATVLLQRAGDEEWGVTSLVHPDLAVQPRTCSGEKVCPWRRDAPAGQFPTQVFEHSAPGNRFGGPAGWFGCHSSSASRPLLCAGWLLAGADGNDKVLKNIRTGALPRPELPDGLELYGSYAEMAIANGVDPDLPALYERPAPAQARPTSPTSTPRRRRTTRYRGSSGRPRRPTRRKARRARFMAAGMWGNYACR